MDMGVGLFNDKKHRPTMNQVLEELGAKRVLWDSLVQYVTGNYGIKGGFAFYGKNYGWALRFRKGSKALLSIYPGKKKIIVQIVIGPAQTERISKLNLGKNVKNALEAAHQFPEGRWLFIQMKSKRDLKDIQQLLLMKSTPQRSSRN